MPGASRNNDTAKGDLIPSQATVYVNNELVIIDNDQVAGHPPGGIHSNPTVPAGINASVFVNNKRAIVATDSATCGDKTTGSSNVYFHETGVVPAVSIPSAVAAAFTAQTNAFVLNPNNYRLEEDINNSQVKPNFPGTPEQPASIGASLIDQQAATANTSPDAIPSFLAQILTEASSGKWDETGMGGAPSNQTITGIWRELGYPNANPWTNDQTAWCMGFVNWVLKRTGFRYVQTARARDIADRASAYQVTQIPLNQGQPGDVALWSYSHVNFIYNVISPGKYTFVGGNQSTKAKAANNPSGGSVTLSWPSGYTVPGNNSLVSLWRPVKS